MGLYVKLPASVVERLGHRGYGRFGFGGWMSGGWDGAWLHCFLSARRHGLFFLFFLVLVCVIRCGWMMDQAWGGR